ncbi:hypothetical protein Tco_0659079 [Tanacetum coccineum]
MFEEPKSFMMEKTQVAIGYKNPLCLARAKQAQSALYNGHVLVTTNHTPTVIHDSEDTRELAEITGIKSVTMQKPLLCVENKSITRKGQTTLARNLCDSIKINRAHTSEKTSTMLNEIESLKAQLRSKEPCLTSDYVKPKVLAPGMYVIDVKPIPHPLKNNRSAHLNYISHLKESVETVREIVEEARVVKPLDIHLTMLANTLRVNDSTEASGSKPRSNTKKNRILPAKKENKKEVEVRLRTNKSVWTKVNRVDSSISSKRVVINSNSESVNSASHGMCVVNILNSVNATPTVRIVLNKEKQI